MMGGTYNKQVVQIEPQQSNNTSTTTRNCVHILNSQQTQNAIKVAERKKIKA
jgi:hypothetical protein